MHLCIYIELFQFRTAQSALQQPLLPRQTTIIQRINLKFLKSIQVVMKYGLLYEKKKVLHNIYIYTLSEKGASAPNVCVNVLYNVNVCCLFVEHTLLLNNLYIFHFTYNFYCICFDLFFLSLFFRKVILMKF